MKDVVVLLPGIMGSALAKGESTVWDVSASVAGRALLSGGGSIKDLALASDADTGSGVTATHLLQDVHLVPFFWKIDGYSGLSRFIQAKLGATPGEDYFEFPYDWRLDNRISARRLAAAAASWLDRQRSAIRTHARAHRPLMGGLVARYFIEVLGGWRTRRCWITPHLHRGSVKALDFGQRAAQRSAVHAPRPVGADPVISSAHQLLPSIPARAKRRRPCSRWSASIARKSASWTFEGRAPASSSIAKSSGPSRPTARIRLMAIACCRSSAPTSRPSSARS
jgi:hypothetical protein